MTTAPLPPLPVPFRLCINCHDLLSNEENECFCTKNGISESQDLREAYLTKFVHAREDAVKDNLVKIYENMSIANVDLMQKEIQSLIKQLERKK